MQDLRTVSKTIRTAIVDAGNNGTIVVPPCVRVNVRVNRRGLMPRVDITFSEATMDTIDNYARWMYGDTIDTWRFNPRNRAYNLSEQAQTTADKIMGLVKQIYGRSCTSMTRNGTIAVFVIPERQPTTNK